MPRLLTLYGISRHKWPAAFALLAMLLLFVAPGISQQLRWPEAPAVSVHSMMMPGMEMHHSSQISSTALVPSALHNPLNPMDDNMLACGYCVLLVHFAMMLCCSVILLSLLLKIKRARPPALIIPEYCSWFTGIHRPRGPPQIH